MVARHLERSPHKRRVGKRREAAAARLEACSGFGVAAATFE